MNEYDVIKIKGESLGIGGKNGFIGHWQITENEIKDFGKDLWCEGTDYSIAPFASTEEEFMGRCLDRISSICSVDFVKNIKRLHIRKLYVPMVKAGDKCVCLHSQDPWLSYQFFKAGVSNLPEMPMEPFDINKVQRGQYEFLSIWLSLSDLEYHAKSSGLNFDSSSLKVLLLPVYHLAFTSNGEEYNMMSWGDATLTNLTHSVLPEDYKFTGKELVYPYPFFTIMSMLSIFCALVCTGIYFSVLIWSLLDCFFFYKILALCIPIFIVNCITWLLIKGMVRFCSHILFTVELKASKRFQRKYILKNLSETKTVIQNRFRAARTQKLSADDFYYDNSVFESNFYKFTTFIEELNFNRKWLT